LARLVEHQRFAITDVSRIASVGEAELRRVLDGTTPDPAMLLRLAPPLGLRGVDLLVAAGSKPWLGEEGHRRADLGCATAEARPDPRGDPLRN
jgi:hypothetical protein